MKIAVGNSRMDKKRKNKELPWADFLARVSTTIRTTETVSEYRKLKKGQQDGIKDVGGFVGGYLKEGRRKNGNVLCRELLTLDMDYAKPNMWAEIQKSMHYRCCIYSTHKHTPENPRLRMIIPLSREVSEDEYPALGRMAAREIARSPGGSIDLFDDTTYEPARLMYWPSTPSDGEFEFEQQDGELLNPDVYLSKYKDWRDVSTWPISSRQSEVVGRTLVQQADPLTKPGVVGAFCRAYSIEGAIETFLANVYEPSAMDGRYDYIPADSTAGVVVYDGKFAYSHHATDPAQGKLMNAFDLVRIHKYGDLEEKASFKAMSDFAVKDELVKAEFAQKRKTQAEVEFTEDEDWQTNLELDKQGNIKDTLANISAILRYDENLQFIVFNQLKCMIDVIGKLPWTQPKPGWNDTDLANAKIYFERAYGIWSPTKFKDALLGVISAERLYNPIKDYLNSLTWDGVPRLDTMLIDYIGAEDIAYVKAVTRKTLCAAVARIFRPGIKFDSVLVLNGPQGIGKSTLFSILGKHWYSDSLFITDMKDKSAAEKLQGYWIMELGELAGIKKVDVETVKSFVTRVDDKYRQSYGVTVESHPRTCIIVGSSNSDTGFLRDITGNRRFWPVTVTGCGKDHPWDLQEVDQIWAEAVTRWNDGEELFLKGEIAEQAVVAQRSAMEGDDRDGLVADYLDALLPENWSDMDSYERRNFLYGSDFGDSNLKGTIRRDRVCVMEIWCECFGKPKESIKKADSYELEGTLYRIGGWKRYDGSKSGKMRISGYGVQKAYVPIALETADNK